MPCAAASAAAGVARDAPRAFGGCRATPNHDPEASIATLPPPPLQPGCPKLYFYHRKVEHEWFGITGRLPPVAHLRRLRRRVSLLLPSTPTRPRSASHPSHSLRPPLAAPVLAPPQRSTGDRGRPLNNETPPPPPPPSPGSSRAPATAPRTPGAPAQRRGPFRGLAAAQSRSCGSTRAARARRWPSARHCEGGPPGAPWAAAHRVPLRVCWPGCDGSSGSDGAKSTAVKGLFERTPRARSAPHSPRTPSEGNRPPRSQRGRWWAGTRAAACLPALGPPTSPLALLAPRSGTATGSPQTLPGPRPAPSVRS